jgi:hypothetical protein
VIFPYKKIGGLKYGPVAPLALKGVDRWVPFDAFVDSGADYSVFHSDVASLIGLKLYSGEKKIVTVGDGDEMIVYVHRVRVRFADFLFKAPIAFSTSLGSGFNLLGREAFFEKFQICFNDRDCILRVTKL